MYHSCAKLLGTLCHTFALFHIVSITFWTHNTRSYLMWNQLCANLKFSFIPVPCEFWWPQLCIFCFHQRCSQEDNSIRNQISSPLYNDVAFRNIHLSISTKWNKSLAHALNLPRCCRSAPPNIQEDNICVLHLNN